MIVTSVVSIGALKGLALLFAFGTALSAYPTLQSGNLAWQKVNKALSNASPAAQGAFKALKTYLATQKGNPDLNFKAFSKADLLTTDDGFAIGAGAAKIYAIYIKKGNDVTDAWFTVVDEGTDANIYGGSLTASYRLVIPSLSVNQEDFYVNPAGFDIAVGIRLASLTAGAAGTTASVAEADSVDGFIIYGAA